MTNPKGILPCEMEYFPDFLANFKKNEHKFVTGYTTKEHVTIETPLTWKNRLRLLSWLLEIRTNRDLCPTHLFQRQKHDLEAYDTWFQSVYLFDKLCHFVNRCEWAPKILASKNLQLHASSCWTLATKNDGIEFFQGEMMSHLTGETYAADKLREAESYTFKLFKYNVGSFCNPCEFVRFLDTHYNLTAVELSTCDFIMISIILMAPEAQEWKPSLIASVAVALSLYIFREEPQWGKEAERISGYNLDKDLKPLIPVIWNAMSSASGEGDMQIIIDIFNHKISRSVARHVIESFVSIDKENFSVTLSPRPKKRKSFFKNPVEEIDTDRCVEILRKRHRRSLSSSPQEKAIMTPIF